MTASDNLMRVLFVVDAFPDEMHVWDGVFLQDQAKALSARTVVGVALYQTCSPGQLLRNRGRMPRDGVDRREGLDLYRMTSFVPTTRSDELLIRARARAIDRAASLFEERHGRLDLIHAHCAAFAGETALRVGRGRGVPVVITEHYSFLPDLIEQYGERLLRVYEEADLVLAVSESLARRMSELGVRREVRCFPNTVDTEAFSFAALEPAGDGVWRLLCVARDHEVKDVPGFVQALSRLPGGLSFDATIVGPGEYRRARAMAGMLGLGERIRFAGELPRSALAQLMRQSHLVVSSSRVETFGMTLAEALCVGRPVVSTDSGGPRDIVRPQDGRLVPVGDSRALAEAIADVLGHYGEYDQAALSASARQRFGVAAFAERMLSVYRDALRGVESRIGVGACN